MRAVVEDVSKRREPLPALVGVYFVSPSDDTVRQLVRDFSLASVPQYKAAHVFFSSRPSPQHLAAIRECGSLVSRLRTLKEVSGWVGRWWVGWRAGLSVFWGGRAWDSHAAALSLVPQNAPLPPPTTIR